VGRVGAGTHPVGQILGKAPTQGRKAKRFKSHDQAEHQHQPCQPTPGQPLRDLQTVQAHSTRSPLPPSTTSLIRSIRRRSPAASVGSNSNWSPPPRPAPRQAAPPP